MRRRARKTLDERSTRFEILGPLQVRGVALGGPQQRAVLAILLLRANETVSREAIVDGLWERPPRTAAHTVETYVSRLRKLLGADRLLTRGHGYALRVE